MPGSPSIVQEGGPNFEDGAEPHIELPPAELIRATVDKLGIVKPKGYDVSFHYNSNVEQFHFGKTHPMKPWRLQLTKQLILSYGLHYAMDVYKTRMASKEEIAVFHNEEYLDFLES